MYQMLPLSHQYLTHVSSNQVSHSTLGKTWKSGPNPLVLKQSTFWIVDFLIFGADLLPLLDFLHFLGHFFGLLLWRHILISMSLVYNLPKAGEGKQTVYERPKWNTEASSYYKCWCSKQLIAKGTFDQSPLYPSDWRGGEEAGKET